MNEYLMTTEDFRELSKALFVESKLWLSMWDFGNSLRLQKVLEFKIYLLIFSLSS